MNHSMTVALLMSLGFLGLFPVRSAIILKTSNHHSSVSTNTRGAFKKSISGSIHKGPAYHSKSNKRHLRKKKQFIIAGFGGNIAAGLPAYGLGYEGLAAASNNQLGYASSNTYPYGLGTFNTGTQDNMISNSLTPSTANLQSRQSLLSSFNGVTNQGLNNYDTTGLSNYGNGGINSNALQNSVASLGYGPKFTNNLSNGLGSSFNNGLATDISKTMNNGLSNSLSNVLSNRLSNGLTSNGLSNSLLTGVNSYTGIDTNQASNINGLSSLVSQSATNDLVNPKYTAESLSAGLDTPNGIANIANLLNSASTSFDTDSQSQTPNNAAYLNKIGQRFGNQASPSQQVLTSQHGFGSLGQQSSTAAEVQAFNNQLNHLSTGKLKLGGNTHANFGSYGDNIDSNLNEIGQIASTGISDSSLQKLLGQLMAGQFGRGNHDGQSSPGLAGLPSDSGLFDTGNSESVGSPQQEQLDDQQGLTSPLIAPVIHGQTIHAHASDKPKYHVSDDQGVAISTSSASQKALNVQIKANKEHQLKLKNLKEKLRMLREKLHKLKQEYDDGDEDENDNEMISDLTEKSELDTLDDLKKATEDAITQLRREMSKVAKRKGGKKVIFIHKFPQLFNSDAKKKGETLGDPETEMLELIDDDSQKKPNKKTEKHQENHLTLTEIEKQAEQEVNYLTEKNPKVVRKKQTFKFNHSRHPPNTGLHIHKTVEHVPANKTRRGKHSLGFFSIGCWRDQPERALTSLEGIFPILDGNDYIRRKYAIRKCAQVARVQGFPAFAIENGGHCLAGKNALLSYSIYGPSKRCKQDGRGGPWSMEVYKFTASSINPKNRRDGILQTVDGVKR